MVIHFDKDNLKKRLKTVFKSEDEILFYTIYDFAFKYRTRIFDDEEKEVAYVEKDIFSEGKADLFDYKGHKLCEINKTADGYTNGEYLYIGDIDKGKISDLFVNDDGKLTIDDEDNVLFAIMFMTGLVEITRED